MSKLEENVKDIVLPIEGYNPLYGNPMMVLLDENEFDRMYLTEKLQQQ